MNMQFIRRLPIPKAVKEQYPLDEKLAQVKAQRDREIQDIFTGKSDKFLLVIGPCSADNPDSVLEYVHRLRRLQDEVKDKILLVPRVYTGKPRTTGDGYKGMLHQPNPTQMPDLFKGIVTIREMHMQILRETGFGCAEEMLYPENHRYLSDLLVYVAVGARSVENQYHRLTASGVDVPVGMKNPTSGDISIMMNAITAAQHKHAFIYRNWEVHSQGNPMAHAILRGYVDERGHAHPNYHYEDLANLAEAYDQSQLKNPAVLVDTNHANSSKQYLEQIRISNEILHSCRHNTQIKKLVKGLMIESYLEDGCQKIGEGVFGKSITDPCLGWEKSRDLVLQLAWQL